MTTEIKRKPVKPFLRWAGGKTWLTKHIDNYIPTNFNDYYEPFLGGGSIFFYLKSKGYIKNKAFLSDSNPELINTYKILKNNHKELFYLLQNHVDTEDEYYRIRNTEFTDPIERAAQFLYLNKTSFNGIYRVNRNGKYNVPYGKRKLDSLYDFEHLTKVSITLKNTYLSTQDFKNRCKKIHENDFVFIDPPYTVAHENNGFIQYNQSIFSWKNQIQLAKQTIEIDRKGAFFLVTNAYHDCIKEIYTLGSQEKLSRASTIGGIGAKRTNYKEIIITNTV
ncbi:DNA adenine methylase [Aequorivita lipolytica]|uniref:site-specific DNA-methyltransferase (adenine-specific) n=1 Tax=Aequorivita lipolytica TaxID=153267 RepID=A0A5C6YM84_9FLAO|nr:Dam family site-specific DNA-(adenine-N6)-methyltransferase [Aequorivita lipolytica]TXD68358.1 Dam family site-specific DNA-(adenine-N6)-methyltransferase [Aequorivita lipolytica]SRX53365.1 Modification methylase DpnIIA [Aequorivita lipolytica]